jgi:hypothetical protein
MLDKWQHITLPAEIGKDKVNALVREAKALSRRYAAGAPLDSAEREWAESLRSPEYLQRSARSLRGTAEPRGRGGDRRSLRPRF